MRDRKKKEDKERIDDENERRPDLSTESQPPPEKAGANKEVEELKKQLEEKEKEAKENYDRFLRMA
ncbi:MAG: hypothetical protein EHM36_09840, partial [Deltaproteobacteria bacterium]